MVGFPIHQHESATGVHVSPHPELPFHPPLYSIPLGCPKALALTVLLHTSALNLHCLENSMDRGAWLSTVHGVSKNQIRLSNNTFTSLSCWPSRFILALHVSACWQKSRGYICSLIHAFAFIQADVRHGKRQQKPSF